MSNELTATVNELLAVAVAGQIRDCDMAFVGVGTNGRAFSLAVGIPLVALRLAQLRHAPNATVFWGGLLEPDLSRIPANLHQDHVTRWRASAAFDTSLKCDMLARGGFDVSFDSAAQVDRYGNLNITAIGQYREPSVRLIGCLAQPEHLAFVRRPIIIMDLKRHAFVENVDFVTSVGHRTHGQSRKDLGLASGGPQLIVTDKAIFDFEGTGHSMRLRSLHAGVTAEEVLNAMSFKPEIADSLTETPLPSADDLHAIRTIIDPDQVLLRW